MRIFVAYARFFGHYASALEIPSTSTVLDVADEIEAHTFLRYYGVILMPPMVQFLIFDGRRLHLSCTETLWSCGVRECSTIYVCLRDDAGHMDRGYVVKD